MISHIGARPQTSLAELITLVKDNTEASRDWIVQTQGQLTASIDSAQRALDQTADSFKNIEVGLLEALGGTQKTLQGINKVLRLEAEDEDEEQMIRNLGRKIDTAITAFIWVFLGGGIVLVVIATLFVHDRFTAKSKLKRQLESLGIDVGQLAALSSKRQA